MSEVRLANPPFKGKHHTEEVKKQISNSLIERNIRIGHDGQELPKYIKYVNWEDRKGYAIISHPDCKKKDFTKKSKTMDELYQEALDHLEKLNIKSSESL
jgi:hypothetical protein